MRSTFSGITNKGIGLNKSTFKEIEETYGEKDWQYQGADFLHPQYVQKSYDGIVFMKKVDIEIPSDDSVLQMFINEKVDEIEINLLRK
jgi:hypothetical protein